MDRKMAMRSISQPKPEKASPEGPRIILHVRIEGKQKAEIQRKARKYTKGNLSAWTRHAAENYVPKLGEKIAVPYKPVR